MKFINILIPVNGAKVDEEAVKLACRLAKPDKAKLYAVNIIPVDRTLPLDAEVVTEVQKGETILSFAENVAKNNSYVMETDLLQAREPGPAIIDIAREREIDLILIGLDYKSRFGEFSLGSVVPYIMKNAPCRVIVYYNQHAENKV
ncbi:MAG: universal stress protein [Dehalococcoidales bacterium]|jgi:nucleotide-binding universal stress UspA family protein|nr:universal stress protein [Dehalococcoidales bacterium]